MSLTSECLARLGLRTEPFGPVPEDSALYRDALLDGFGDLALRALAEPSAVLVLAGAGGVGRSTQLQQILSLLGDDIDLIAFRARPKVAFEAVDATLRFHLSQLGSEDSSASLLHLLGERLRAGRALLLAVDDAHLLSSAVLEHLFALRGQLLERLGATARFFLVGDPAFAANPLPGLDAEVDTQVLRLHLRAFNREQTHGYLRHRLLSAGHAQPDALLKRELVERLHGSSSGLPKYLNALAEDWLEERCDQGASYVAQGQIDQQEPARARVPTPPPVASPAKDVAGDAMVTAMTALEALRNASSQALEASGGALSGSQADASRSARSRGGHATAPDEQSSGSGSSPGKGRRRDGKESKKAKGRPRLSGTAVGEPVPLWNRPWFVPGVAVFSLFALLVPLVWQLPGSGGGGSARHQPAPGSRLASRPAPVAPGVPSVGPQSARPAVGQPGRRELDVPSILPGQPAEEGPAVAAMPDAGPTDAVGVPELSAANGEQGTTGSDEKQRNVPPEQAVSEQADDRGSAANSDGLDRDWIRRQSGQHFTIQLAAARSLTAARQHVTGFGDLPVRFVPTRSNSQEFVVVLAGVYPGRAEAERALEKLPKALREQGYWVRSVDSVRRSLRDD